MKGFHFKTYEAPEQSPFDRLFEIFKELIVHTSGDFDEAISWMRELDVEYKLTDEKYTIDDFIEDLKKKGYYVKKPHENIFKTAKKKLEVLTELPAKTEQVIICDPTNAQHKEYEKIKKFVYSNLKKNIKKDGVR